MLIIFLGATASGKGTISSILSKSHGFEHISTGDIFREHIKNKTKLGKKVKSLIGKGNLVDDKTTWKIAKSVLEEIDLKKTKVILDGFPRNIIQSNLMNTWLIRKGLKPAIHLYFDVSQNLIFERLIGRRICEICGKVYNTKFSLPKEPGICDIDSGKLYQREDDKIENVQVRLDVYEKTTKPLVDLYKKNKKLLIIDGNLDKEDITKNVLEALENDFSKNWKTNN